MPLYTVRTNTVIELKARNDKEVDDIVREMICDAIRRLKKERTEVNYIVEHIDILNIR